MKIPKTFNRITLIAWGTIAVMFVMCSIIPNNAQAKLLFKARIDYAVDGGLNSVATGDLNGDGDQDLVVLSNPSGASSDGTVSVLLGNGDGSFQAAVNYAAADWPRSVAIDDLNGDGDLDLAVAKSGSYNVSVLLGNGDGSFQNAVNYDVGNSPRSVAIGDLNGDDHPDLAVANLSSDNVSVLLGNGDGSFQSAVNYGTGDAPNSIAIGDLNGDDDLDLTVANHWSTVSVLLGNGDGSFQSAVNYEAGGRPKSVAIGDLNGDGDLDLTVANGSDWDGVSVLLSNGDGTFQSAVKSAAHDEPRSVAIDDLNGDGDLDLAVANSDSSDISVLLGNGDGTFQEAPHFKAEGGTVAIGDLNGDGNLDLVTDGVSVLLGNGDGTYQSAVNYSAGDRPCHVAIGDLNGDDHPDLAVANADSDNVSVLLGNGDGTFQSAVNYSAGDSPCSVAIGDLNGDDDMDLAVANHHSDNVSVLLGNGDGTFQTAVNYGAGDRPTSVAIGDLNGDDDLDLAVANFGYFSKNVSVLLGNGDGTFLSAVNYDAGDYSVFIVTGDLNGDDNLDLAVTNDTDDNVSVLLGNGDGTFLSAMNYSAGDTPVSVAIGDLNGDANPDLAVANTGGFGTGNVSVLLGNGDGSFEAAVGYAAGDKPSSVAVGDLNGDGNPDLAVAAGDVYILINIVRVAKNLLYSPVTPCRIADTRRAGSMIGASTERDFHVFGGSSTISAQGGNSAGCFAPMGEPLAAHINMIAVNPTGKGNLQAFPVGAGTGAGLSVNYNTIDTNLANAGTVKAITGTGPDITVASNFSSAHTVIDVLGYYYPDEGFYYTPVAPCRIADTRKTSAGRIDAGTERDFRVFGPVGDQGGNPGGCPSPVDAPSAAHLNMVAVDPSNKGNLQAFPVDAGAGAGMSVNYNTIDTNLANAGTVKTVVGAGPDITVASNFSSAHMVIDVLGYYSEEEDLLYTPVIPCRIVDTRKTSAGMIDANTERDFRVFGPVSVQGGNSSGCSAPMGEPLAAHINMIAVNPTGKGNLQAFPVGAGTGAGLSVNYNTIDTNLANAGTVKTVTGAGADITVASNFSSAHTVIDVLGYYYTAP